VSDTTIIGSIKAGEMVTQDIIHKMLRNARYKTGASVRNLSDLTIVEIRETIHKLNIDIDSIKTELVECEGNLESAMSQLREIKEFATFRFNRYIMGESENI